MESMENQSNPNQIAQKLKAYLANTHIKDILKQWQETQEFDKVGPTMDQFLNPIKK